MPELPEVQTTVEGLRKYILGKTILEVWSDFHIGTAHGHKANLKNKSYYRKFKKEVQGQKIISVERIGKNILINLSGSFTIVVHMKMTGHFLVKNFEKEKKYIHLVFTLSGGQQVALSDMRKFASVVIWPTAELNQHERVGKLGPDPLDPELNVQKLFEILQTKKGVPIKSALMDQSVLSGIGNIYSDEILWQAGIHPLSKANKIPQEKVKEIFKEMKRILAFSIRHGGDSHSDYRNIQGEKGGFQNFHRVYGRKGQKCSKPGCGGIIERKVIRGRSSHYCPKHQKIYG